MDLNIDNPEQIKQLIQMLQKMLPLDENTSTENSIIKTKSVKPGKKNTTNKFVDMPEKNMHKADILIDKKLNIHPPTPRTRTFSKIEVVCRICGKKEKVNPSILPDQADRYKCNKCSSSSGN